MRQAADQIAQPRALPADERAQDRRAKPIDKSCVAYARSHPAKQIYGGLGFELMRGLAADALELRRPNHAAQRSGLEILAEPVKRLQVVNLLPDHVGRQPML